MVPLVFHPNDILIGSAIFAGLAHVTNTQSQLDHATSGPAWEEPTYTTACSADNLGCIC